MNHPWALYVAVGAGSWLLTIVLTPLCRRLATTLDVVDRPSAPRKIHARAIPYLGGLPFYICFLATLLFIEWRHPEVSAPVFFPMAVIGTLIVLMGIYDDICDMSSLKKLVVELALGVAFYYWGFQRMGDDAMLGGAFNYGQLAVIVAPLWIAGIMNAVNFSDGLDGLAGGLVFICAAAVFAIGLANGQVLPCVLMVYLMGTTLGFLRYNFNPASIFMGDTGALFLGFVLGTATLLGQQKGVTVIALAVPMIVMAVPLLDTALSFLRRLRRAREGAFFSPDRHHLHHRLLALGLTQRQVVLALYYVSVGMGLMAFILSGVPPTYSYLILVLAAMAIVAGVAVLRFIEGFAHGRGR